MTSHLHRKYIDLIFHASNKYVNWDPLHEVKVGTYGLVDTETGEMCVEGNIYDPEFQQELDKHDVKINLADFPPLEGPVEDDLIITSRGAKRKDWDASKDADIPGIANAPVKGKWAFERVNKREAVLIMHRPRQISIPPGIVLEPLYKVDKLVEKCLVTSKYVCPAYSMYLSEKSTDTTSDTASLALVAQVPAAGATDAIADGLNWWVDTSSGVFRNGYDPAGEYTFTPVSTVKRPIKRIRRFFRDKIRPEPAGDELWFFETPPWEPLDEDGGEDPLDPEIRAIDPFAHVNEVARLKQLEEQLAAASLSSC